MVFENRNPFFHREEPVRMPPRILTVTSEITRALAGQSAVPLTYSNYSNNVCDNYNHTSYFPKTLQGPYWKHPVQWENIWHFDTGTYP